MCIQPCSVTSEWRPCKVLAFTELISVHSTAHTLDLGCFIPNTLRAPNYPLVLGTNLWASSQYVVWVQ